MRRMVPKANANHHIFARTSGKMEFVGNLERTALGLSRNAGIGTNTSHAFNVISFTCHTFDQTAFDSESCFIWII